MSESLRFSLVFSGESGKIGTNGARCGAPSVPNHPCREAARMAGQHSTNPRNPRPGSEKTRQQVREHRCSQCENRLPESYQRRSCEKCLEKSRRLYRTRTKAYRVWAGMRQRCFDPNFIGYRYYGARGITVDPRWATFDSFLVDMGEPPAGDEWSLDRIDNDGPYSPENCRWATRKQQQRNRSSRPRYTYQGETLTIAEWAERFGISRKTLRDRLSTHKWPIERALSEPINPRPGGYRQHGFKGQAS